MSECTNTWCGNQANATVKIETGNQLVVCQECKQKLLEGMLA